MAFTPIATGIQYEKTNGAPYSGAVLKAYRADGTTAIQMATDSTGSTLVWTITLNTLGMPSVSGNFVFPHIDQVYRIALYPTQAAADANSGQIWITPSLTTAGILPTLVDSIENFNELRNHTGFQGLVNVKGGSSAGDGLGGSFYKVIGAAPGTYTDNNHTIILPTGGDGGSAWIVVPERNAHLSAGTSAAYTVAGLPATLTTDRVYNVRFHTPNDAGVVTLSPGGGSTVPIKQRDDTTNLLAGQISAGVHMLQKTASNLILLDPDKFSAGAIPGLDASKITSGTFANARISESSVTQHVSKPITKVKTADTSRNTTTTLTDDPHLTSFNLPVGTYLIKGVLLSNTASGIPKLKYAFELVSGTVGTSLIRFTNMSVNSVTDSETGTLTTTFFPEVTAGAAGHHTIINGYVVVSAAAVIDLQWAQFVSDAADVTLREGSSFEFLKVA